MTELTQEIVRELLDYDPATGVFTWKRRDRKWFASDRIRNWWNAKNAGKAGVYEDRGSGLRYHRITILKRRYYAHRLAWLYMTGQWPTGEVDHINHDGSDNRWQNLREVPHAVNGRNQSLRNTNTSGFVGVQKTRNGKNYKAEITVNGRNRYLGSFSTIEQAVAARQAAQELYGYSRGHGEVRL